MALRGAATQIIGRLVQAVLQATALIALSRMLGPDEIGVAALAMTVVALPGVFREFGLGLPTVRWRQISDDVVSSLFWLSVTAGIGAATIVALASPIVARIYDDERVGKAMLVLAIEFVVSGFAVQHSAILRRNFRNRAMVIVDIAAESAGLIVGVLMAINDASYTAVLGRVLAFQLARVVFLFWTVNWRPARPSWTRNSSGAAREGAFAGLYDVANYFSRNSDDLLIGWRWGTIDLGLYRRAYELLMLPLRLITAPLGAVAVPFFSRTVDDPARFKRGLTILLDHLLLIGLPIAVLFLVFPEIVIGVSLGSEWAGASEILRWMSALAVFQPIVGSSGWVFLAEGRAAEYGRLGVVTSAITVGAFVVAVGFGPTAVAAAYTLVSLLITMPLVVVALTRRGIVSPSAFTSPLVRALVIGGIASAAIWPLRGVLDEMRLAHLFLAAAASFSATTVLGLLTAPGRARLRSSIDLARRLLAGPRTDWEYQ